MENTSWIVLVGFFENQQLQGFTQGAGTENVVSRNLNEIVAAASGLPEEFLTRIRQPLCGISVTFTLGIVTHFAIHPPTFAFHQ